jgi:putative transposase
MRILNRMAPVKGVKIIKDQPTVVFLTVCAKDRGSWIGQESVHRMIVDIWSNATAWLVGEYLLMPDHLHLFCTPNSDNFSIEQWLIYWKRGFSRKKSNADWLWQRNAFHHRIRDQNQYKEKLEYVRQNPVRRGLVRAPEDWPHCGEINIIKW